jgi:hypothetical protein
MITIIRTPTALTRADIRRLQRRYELRAIETRHQQEGDITQILWEREDGPDAITEAELPF